MNRMMDTAPPIQTKAEKIASMPPGPSVRSSLYDLPDSSKKLNKERTPILDPTVIKTSLGQG
jgi:hypothetical protein